MSEVDRYPLTPPYKDAIAEMGSPSMVSTNYRPGSLQDLPGLGRMPNLATCGVLRLSITRPESSSLRNVV